MFSKTNEINAYEGDYRIYLVSSGQQGSWKTSFAVSYALSWVMSISTRAKRYHYYVFLEPFVWSQNTFWSNTTSTKTIWLNAREWELIAICKIWYEFLKICNSWNFLLLKFPKTLQISFRFGRAHSRGGKWWESFQILQSFQVDISIEIDKYDI